MFSWHVVSSSFATPSMDCSLPSSSVHGISQARIVERVAISSSGGSSRPRDRTRCSCLAGGFLTTEPPGSPPGERSLGYKSDRYEKGSRRDPSPPPRDTCTLLRCTTDTLLWTLSEKFYAPRNKDMPFSFLFNEGIYAHFSILCFFTSTIYLENRINSFKTPL